MEEKKEVKIKMFCIITLIIVFSIIFLIQFGNFIYKYSILQKYQMKLSEIENSMNYTCMQHSYYRSNSTSVEFTKKDNIRIVRTAENSFWKDLNTDTAFYISTQNSTPQKLQMQSNIMEVSLPDIMKNTNKNLWSISLNSRISQEYINQKSCYLIEIYDKDYPLKIYLDKDTFLPLLVINTNNSENLYTVNEYDFTFNQVDSSSSLLENLSIL